MSSDEELRALAEKDREVARQRLAALNVDGWRAATAHGCDGTEEGCAATCPIQVQERVSPDEIIDAITEPLLDRLARVEALADEWRDWASRLNAEGDFTCTIYDAVADALRAALSEPTTRTTATP